MSNSSIIISKFNALDVGFIILIFLSALIGIIRGFTREFFGIIGWIGAILVTLWCLPYFKPMIQHWVSNAMIADIISALVLFIVSFVTFMTVIRSVSDHVKNSILGSLDRSLGLLFGIFRGSILAIALFLLSNLIWKPTHCPPLLLSAKCYPILIQGTETTLKILPPGFISSAFFKINVKSQNDKENNPERLMQALSQPRLKENIKSMNGGYQDKQRKNMERLIQNYKADEDV